MHPQAQETGPTGVMCYDQGKVTAMQKTEDTRDIAPASQTDWKRLRSMTDAEITAAAKSDPDSAPILSLEEVRRQYKPHPPRIRR